MPSNCMLPSTYRNQSSRASSSIASTALSSSLSLWPTLLVISFAVSSFSAWFTAALNASFSFPNSSFAAARSSAAYTVFFSVSSCAISNYILLVKNDESEYRRRARDHLTSSFAVAYNSCNSSTTVSALDLAA